MSEREEETPGWRRAASEAHLTIELPGGVPMFFRRIEPGEFRMGSRDGRHNEEPVHRVCITRPFHLGTFPVTQEQFAAWKQAEGVEHKNEFEGKRRPAENMSWDEATAFCGWLNRTGLVPSGWQASLPTEAQWEFACRAGTETDYHEGDGVAALARVGWFEDNSEGETHAVGALGHNGWHLYDMHGNVWEWCLDAYDGGAYRGRLDGVEDPICEARGSSNRVLRGGSWNGTARNCRSAFRNWGRPDVRDWVAGFRVCLLPGPGVQPGGRGAAGRKRAKARPGQGRRGGTPSGREPGRAGAEDAGGWEGLKLPKPERD